VHGEACTNSLSRQRQHKPTHDPADVRPVGQRDQEDHQTQPGWTVRPRSPTRQGAMRRIRERRKRIGIDSTTSIKRSRRAAVSTQPAVEAGERPISPRRSPSPRRLRVIPTPCDATFSVRRSPRGHVLASWSRRTGAPGSGRAGCPERVGQVRVLHVRPRRPSS